MTNAARGTLKRVAAVALATTVAATTLATTAVAAPATTPKIPNNVSLRAKDVRSLGATQVFDLGSYSPGSVTFAGQYCDTTDNGATGTEPLPAAGRWWMWFDGTNDLDVGVDHVVTTWDDGARALADAKADTGHCRTAALGYGDYVVHPTAADSLLITWENRTTVAGRLVGNTVVTVSVSDWNDRIDETAEAERLLDVAVAKVARSNKLP